MIALLTETFDRILFTFMNARQMELEVTDDLNATIRHWLKLYTDQEAAPDMPDWTELMQSLQQTGWQHLPDQQAEILSIMTQESIEFTRFASQLIQQHQQQDTPELASFFQDFHQHINRLCDDFILQRWLLPEQLSRLMKTRPGDTLSGIDQSWFQALDGFLNVTLSELPYVQQASFRDMKKHLHEHHQALMEYTQHYTRINTHALNQLSQTLEAREQPISSLRELHSIWVNAYEVSYAECIATDEYQLAYGRISNTLMQLKLWLQQQRNQYLTQMGIATEASLNLAFEKIHQLSKQVRQLEILQQQTELLHREINQIKNNMPANSDNRS